MNFLRFSVLPALPAVLSILPVLALSQEPATGPPAPGPEAPDVYFDAEVRLADSDWTSEGVSATATEPDAENLGMGMLFANSAGAYMLPASWTNESDATVDLVQSRFTFRHPEGYALSDATVTPGMVLARMENGGVFSVAWLSAGDMYSFDFVDGEVVATVDSCWRLEPGEEANLGGAVVWWTDESDKRFESKRFFAATGIIPNIGYPRELDSGILYEASAGGHINSAFSNVGGFINLGKQAVYLKDLGVGTIWLNAPHEHRDAPNAYEGGWNHYDPRDIAAIEDAFGGEDDLALTSSWFRQKNQIQLYTEIVPHGGGSVQAKALPEWWTRGRDGELLNTWGGYAMDYASPPWQNAIRSVLEMQFAAYGFRGVRIDVADGGGPNWGSPATNHASASTLGASVQLINTVRDAYTETTGIKFPVIIPESPQNRWEHHSAPRAAILHYGHETTQLFDALRRECPDDPAEMARRLKEHFRDGAMALPPKSRVIRTTANHDTVADNGGRANLRFGPGLARAFHAVCVASDGVPMLYQEEEVGHFHHYSRLHAMRNRLPEIARGEAFYDGFDAGDPRVFVVQHIAREAASVALVNLSGEELEGALTFPAMRRPPAGMTYYNAWTGEELTIDDEQRLAWKLAPYDAAFFRIGAEPVGELPVPKWAGEPEKFQRDIQSFRPMLSRGGVWTGAVSMEMSAFRDLGPWEETEDETVRRSDGAELQMWYPEIDGEPAPGPRVRLTLPADSGKDYAAIRLNSARDWMISTEGAVLFDVTLRRHWPFPEEAGIEQITTMSWGGETRGGYYDNVYPWGRLWESRRAPLHPDEPAIAFREPNGLFLHLRNIDTNAENIVLTDMTDEGDSDSFALELRFYRRDDALAPQVRLAGPNQPWRLPEGFEAPGTEEPLVVEFDLRFNTDRSPAAQMTAPRREVLPPGSRAVVDAPEKSSFFGMEWTVQPGTVRWEDLASVPGGERRMRFLARHSETSAEGTDLGDAYAVRLNGKEIETEWVELGVANHGNAWFGWLETEPVDLSAGLELSVETTKPWAALRTTEIRLSEAVEAED